MIKNISLKNFKCFREITVDPKLITVLIGQNGTGKSGVLQAILLLKQSRDNVRQLNLDGELIRFAPEAFMWQGTESISESVGLSLSLNTSVDSEEVEGPIECVIDLRFSGQANLIGNSGSTRWWSSGRGYQISFGIERRTFETITPRGAIEYTVSPQINGFEVSMGMGGERPSSPLWEQMSEAPAKALGELKMVPAARGLTRGIYELGPNSTKDLSGASGLGAQEEDTATTLAYSRRDVERVSSLMKQITGVGIRVDTVPPRSAKPVSESPAGDLSLWAEGFGTNALVHLLFEVVRTAPGATVLVEEPEIHLHPRAQADLASVLAKEAKSGGKQMIIATHSEHVAGRLLTLVAEGELSEEDLSIYSFDKDEGGVCSATEVEVTDRGQVSMGLKSFFETDLDEMRRYVEALRAKA